jgi:hypothetical protein
MNYPDKSFNSTPEGQRAMFYGELSRSVVLTLNAAVRRMGGSAWGENVIQNADASTLAAIRLDLQQEYNSKVLENRPPESQG